MKIARIEDHGERHVREFIFRRPDGREVSFEIGYEDERRYTAVELFSLFIARTVEELFRDAPTTL